jgi:large subunit ribosomal protein L13
MIKPVTKTIDVDGMPLGRAASNVARELMGKEEVGFAPNKTPNILIEIKNIEKIKIADSKKIKKKYFSHSGYLGNLKSKRMGDFLDKSPQDLFLKVVAGMLPRNKLRGNRLAKIKFQLK